jgi:hypothetical protein
MSCLNADRIDRYIEGEMDPAAREDFERHLRSCPACRRAVDEWRLLAEAAAGLPPLELPSDFSRRVMARIGAAHGVSVFGWLFLGAAALVSLVSVGVGVLVLSGHSLTELVLGLEGFLVTTFKSGALVFGQVTSVIGLVVSVVRHYLSALWDALSGFGSVIPLPLAAAVLAVQVLIIGAAAYGLKKILVGVRS